jgi:transposase-like protein
VSTGVQRLVRSKQTPRQQIRNADCAESAGPRRLSVHEHEELARLRLENMQLKRERDLLFKASSHFLEETSYLLRPPTATNEEKNASKTSTATGDITAWVQGLA